MPALLLKYKLHHLEDDGTGKKKNSNDENIHYGIPTDFMVNSQDKTKNNKDNVLTNSFQVG